MRHCAREEADEAKASANSSSTSLKAITVNNAVFRADASAQIGAGHVMRCLALAEALEATGGWRCGFAATPDTVEMVPSIDKLAYRPLELVGSKENEPDDIAREFRDGCDLLVVDHYQRNELFEQACRPWVKRIMVIDDLANRKHDCDILLDQTLGRRKSDYSANVPGTCKVMLGAEHALLRREFAAARSAVSGLRRLHNPVVRILVTLGASDPDNATSLALDGIAQCGFEGSVDVVLGQSAPHATAVQSQIARLPLDVKLHNAAANMSELMCSADIAIGAAGTTSWERCCLGLPTLMVVIAENQRFVAEQLDEAGAAKVLGKIGELSAKNIGDALKGLLNDGDGRSAMSERAFEICDGRGLDRAILALADGGRKKLSLRLASSRDGALMFEWQSHPQTRRFARNPKPPSWQEHSGWMDRTLSESGVLLMIIMLEDEPVGVLRLDQIENSLAREISIYVAPARYGQGLARSALESARSLFPGWIFRADVLPENQGSHALFQSAGYRRLSETRYISNPMETVN